MKITSVEIQKKNPDRRSVFVDGSYCFGIDEEDWFKLNLYVGQDITKQEIERINRLCNVAKAKKQAIKYISYSMRTAFQVAKRLEQQGFDEPVIEEVIGHLKQLQYIDDPQYAAKYIKDAIHIKNFGLHRIVLELQAKGICQDMIDRQLAGVAFDERRALKPLLQKKLSRMKVPDEKCLNRVRNYFIRRGYCLKVINEMIEEILLEKE